MGSAGYSGLWVLLDLVLLLLSFHYLYQVSFNLGSLCFIFVFFFHNLRVRLVKRLLIRLKVRLPMVNVLNQRCQTRQINEEKIKFNPQFHDFFFK